MPVWHRLEGSFLVDTLEPASWKSRLSWACAATLALLFVVSGVWKIIDPLGWAVRTAQLNIPHALSLPAALAVGIAETVGAVWILLPRYRRWGSILLGLLLAGFVVFFAINYNLLRGLDCSCFPWVKRVVGPGFFLADLAMLLLAVLAGFWSQRPRGARPAVVIFATVTVFALVSWGLETQQQSGHRAPATVTVQGQPMTVGNGKVFFFFFNPQCMHCYDSAKRMSTLAWGETKVIAVPVEDPQYAAQFLQETGLRAVVSTDFQKLKSAFGYTSYPYGVLVDGGVQKSAVTNFDPGEPETTLKKLAFVK